MADDKLCLTINDYLELPDGQRVPYCAIQPLGNFAQNDGNHVIEVLEVVPEINTVPQVQVTYTDEIRGETSSLERTPQSLPPGKKYHVFFSHSNEDREWVLQVVNKLESPEYGFKCCFADRDFDLGAPVFENITKCINLSKKTVIVLTPEFLQSSWCSYETRITMEMDLDTRHRLLVPVMLRNCCIPGFIGRLSYIEVENEHFWERFQQALKDETSDTIYSEAIGSAAILGDGPFQFNPNYFNNEIICDVTAYDGARCCQESIAENIPNELLRHGLQITAEDYNEIASIISGTFYIRCRDLYGKAFFWIHLIAVPAILASIIVATNRSPNVSDLYFRVSFYPALVAFLMLVLRFPVIIKAVKTFSEKSVATNKIVIRRNMMIIIKDHDCCTFWCACHKVSIMFMYYDWRPCKSYLKRLLLAMRPSMNEQQIAIDDDERGGLISSENESQNVSEEATEAFEDSVEGMLLHHATEYGQLVLSKRTKKPNEQRHTRQKECLCQFVESILLSGKTSCLDCLYGGPTRHPWRQLIEF